MIRIQNDNFGKALHPLLYIRIRDFCLAHTPEAPAEAFANTILNRFYNNDKRLHLFVELDERSNITAHAIADIQEAFNHRILHVYQLQKDRPDTKTMDEVMEIADKLAEEFNVNCISFSVVKNAKVFAKRYGYTLTRSIMIKLPYADAAQHLHSDALHSDEV
jgi:hypothetical protein